MFDTVIIPPINGESIDYDTNIKTDTTTCTDEGNDDKSPTTTVFDTKLDYALRTLSSIKIGDRDNHTRLAFDEECINLTIGNNSAHTHK